MKTNTTPHRRIVPHDEWLAERKELLHDEKALTKARCTKPLTDAYALLDRTACGRQREFEDSPPGWPQMPTYG